MAWLDVACSGLQLHPLITSLISASKMLILRTWHFQHPCFCRSLCYHTASCANTKCEHLLQHDGDLSLPIKYILLKISLKSFSFGNKPSNCILNLELLQPSLPCFCSANGFHNCRIITICNENSFFSMSSGTTSSWCIDLSSSLHTYFISGNHHSCVM